MITLKTGRELNLMKEACRISANALRLAGRAIEPGISTLELDSIVRKYIEGEGAKPNFLGYGGFPASACISLNDTVIHGIPDKNIILREGDIVSIDTGAVLNGYHGDNAATFAVGKISDEAQSLLNATEESLYEAIRHAVPGGRLGDIGSAVDRYVTERGYSVVRDFVGHGIGTNLHEEPNVPNYGTPNRGVRLVAGMTLAIEPMVNAGTWKVKTLPDGWTVKTADQSLSAHFEHTVAITANGPVILTQADI